jgi:hypothetical protein
MNKKQSLSERENLTGVFEACRSAGPEIVTDLFAESLLLFRAREGVV